MVVNGEKFYHLSAAFWNPDAPGVSVSWPSTLVLRYFPETGKFQAVIEIIYMITRNGYKHLVIGLSWLFLPRKWNGLLLWEIGRIVRNRKLYKIIVPGASKRVRREMPASSGVNSSELLAPWYLATRWLSQLTISVSIKSWRKSIWMTTY